MPNQFSERSPLWPAQSIVNDVDGGLVSDANPAAPDVSLNPISRFIQTHSRAFHVAGDSLSTLATFQVVNNILEGWPETYEENLDTFNKVFAVYFAVQLVLSILYHHKRDEEKKAPLPLAIPSMLLLTSLTMMCYVLDSLQDNIISAQAQITNPDGGANSVSSQSFWEYDFGVPAAIAFTYSALQFGKELHHLLSSKEILNTQKLQDAIPRPVKTTAKALDKLFSFGVESAAVFGSFYQDLAYYSISYAGINLLHYKQYYTSSLYGGGLLLGIGTSALFKTQFMNQLISKKNFEKFIVVTGGALGVSVFYTSNIADIKINGINPSTMTSMVGLPVLLLLATGSYGAYHIVRRNRKHAVKIEPVDELVEDGQEQKVPELVDLKAQEEQDPEGTDSVDDQIQDEMEQGLIPPPASQSIPIPHSILFFANGVRHGSLQQDEKQQTKTHSV